MTDAERCKLIDELRERLAYLEAGAEQPKPSK